MDLERRLEQAIQRGQKTRVLQGQEAAERALTEEELKSRYSAARLNLSEYIETSLKKLMDHFPGFRFETVVDDSGWGARISRDDLHISPAALDALFSGSDYRSKPTGMKRENLYSRFQMLVRPLSTQAKIIEITAKGTIRNKEIVNRTHFQFLAQLNEQGLRDVFDNWCIEYAEHFAVQS